MRGLLKLLGIFALMPGFANASDLGRLFFTQAERYQREAAHRAAPVVQGARSILNGEIRSSRGSKTRWIDGEAIHNPDRSSAGVTVGNTFHPAGRVQEDTLLQGGKITIHGSANRR